MSLLLALIGGVPGSIDFSSATTDGSDVLDGNISPVISCSLATTDGADVAVGNISVTVGVISATTDGSDVFAGNISVITSVSSAITDGADNLAALVDVAGVAIGFSAGIVEGQDYMAGRIQLIVGGHFGGKPKKHKLEVKKRDEELKQQIQKQFEQIIEGKIEISPELQEIEEEFYTSDYIDKVMLERLLSRIKGIEQQLLEIDDEEEILMLM